MLLDAVGSGKARAREHEFPVDADALGLVGIADAQRPTRLDDQADVSLRRQQQAQFVPVVIGVGQVECDLHRVDAQRLQLGLKRLPVVDHVPGTHLPAPVGRGLARRRGDHLETRMAGQLDRHRADPARTADHQQVLAGVAAIVQAQGHALEQQLPSGERGQRQRCGLSEIQRGGFARDQAFVHPLVLRIAAGAGDITGVIDLVTRGEQAGLVADRLDHAGGVPTQHAGRLERGRIRAGTLLAIDGVDRNRLDPDQQVTPTGRQRRGQVDIAQCRGGFTTQGDGFHHGSGWVRGSIIRFLTFPETR